MIDLDGDGSPEVVAARDDSVVVWHADGQVAWRASTEGRVWASPVVADLVPDRPGLEVAAASRSRLYAWDADGNDLPGFPYRGRTSCARWRPVTSTATARSSWSR